MSAGFRWLAAWLSPALWLSMAALTLGRGPDGLWTALGVCLAPLVALGAGIGGEPDRERRPAALTAAVLFVMVGILLWASFALLGDVAVEIGVPRWQAIAVAAAGAWLLCGWRGAGRVVPALLALALGALVAVLLVVAVEARTGPLGAWHTLASRSTFQFPAESDWVTSGRDLGPARRRPPLLFDEDHRVTAPQGGVLRGRSSEAAARGGEQEWTLRPGQSVALRAGDRLDRPSSVPLAFEAGKRVPGAPVSGMAWASAWRSGWLRRVGLSLTVVLGAVALLRTPTPLALARPAVLALGGGLVAWFFWAQGWALYAAFGAPDIFIGGVATERLLDSRAVLHGAEAWQPVLQWLLVAAGLASFLASSVALREQVAAVDHPGGGEVAREVGVWAAVFAATGMASLWPVDAWWLVMLALGIGAAGIGPAALWPSRGQVAPVAAGVIGLGVFAALAVASEWRSALALATPTAVAADGRLLDVRALAEAVLAYPALAAAPIGAVALWICRRVGAS